MNTAQAAYRLLRHARVTDPAALTLSQATEVAGALSSAVATFFRDGPAVLRQTSAAVLLPAPRTVNGYLVERGALGVFVDERPFRPAERGASLAIEGDATRNEIVSALGWLAPYQGQSGVRSMTVYGDAVAIGQRLIERLLSDPWLETPYGARVKRLERVRDEHEVRAWATSQTGEPTAYGILPAGASRGSDAMFVVRVWPAPATPMVLRFEAEVHPDGFDAECIWRAPVDLPFSDSQVETVLLPLAEMEMLRTTLLPADFPESRAKLIRDAAARAEGVLRRIPKNHGKPRGRVRTPTGW